MPIVDTRGNILGTVDNTLGFTPADKIFTQRLIGKKQFITSVVEASSYDAVVLSPLKINDAETPSEVLTRAQANSLTFKFEKANGDIVSVAAGSVVSLTGELDSLAASDPTIVKTASFATNGQQIQQIVADFDDVSEIEVQYVVESQDNQGNTISEKCIPAKTFSCFEPILKQIPLNQLPMLESYRKIKIRQRRGNGRVTLTVISRSVSQ